MVTPAAKRRERERERGETKKGRRRRRCSLARACEQMLYLAPMAKKSAVSFFPRLPSHGRREEAIPSVDKLPIQVRSLAVTGQEAREGEGKGEGGREWNPILLRSLFPFSPFLVHIMSPQLSPFIHTCARSSSPFLSRSWRRRRRWAAAYCDAFAHHIFRSADLPRERGRQARVGGCRKTLVREIFPNYLLSGTRHRSIQLCQTLS